MALSGWSTTAASNASAGSIDFSENQAPNTVNDSARALMADVRSFYDNIEWRDWGHTITRSDDDTFTISSSSDLSSVYVAGRRFKYVGASTVYGVIASTSYAGTTQTVNVTVDAAAVLPLTPTSVSLAVDPSNKPIGVKTIEKGTAGYYLRTDGTDAAWATPYHAALAYRVSNLTHSSSASYIDIPLTSDSYDSGTIHDGGGANPELFEAPSWATKARFIAQVEFDSNTTGNRVLRIVTSAGATLTPGVKCAYAPNASGVTLQLVSPIVPVTGGNSYKLQVYQNSGGSITIYGPDTYMFVEFFP